MASRQRLSSLFRAVSHVLCNQKQHHIKGCFLPDTWLQPVCPALPFRGVFGGMLGGAVAGLTGTFLVKGLGWVLSRSVGLLLRGLAMLLRVPVFILQYLVSVGLVVFSSLKDGVQTFRRL